MDNTNPPISGNICCICKLESDDVCDGICSKCEPLWLNEISKLSNILSPESSIRYLLSQATENAIRKSQK